MFGFFEPTKEDLIREIKLKYAYMFGRMSELFPNQVTWETYLELRKIERKEIDKLK